MLPIHHKFILFGATLWLAANGAVSGGSPQGTSGLMPVTRAEQSVAVLPPTAVSVSAGQAVLTPEPVPATATVASAPPPAGATIPNADSGLVSEPTRPTLGGGEVSVPRAEGSPNLPTPDGGQAPALRIEDAANPPTPSGGPATVPQTEGAANSPTPSAGEAAPPRTEGAPNPSTPGGGSATGPRSDADSGPVVPAANTRLFRVTAADIPLKGSEGVVRNGDAIELERRSAEQYASEGVVLSEPHQAAFPFNNVVLSWNAEAPVGTRLEFQVRVGDGADRSEWFTMGTWEASGGSSTRRQSDPWGSVDVDTLNLGRMATSFEYRVGFSTVDGTSSPRITALGLVYADLRAPLGGPRPALMDGWARDLPVPQFSQLEQHPTVASRICSPTSLTMVLNYWGKAKSVRQVYEGVRDGQTGIYGNWPMNTAYAGSLGLDAYVDRFYSIEQVQNEIAQGRPVIISIRFEPGQLDNSPISSTGGHLIVVRGFTPQGDVIVNDPIAPKSGSVRLIYKRQQLAKIWLDSGGIAYLIRPR